MKRSLIYVAVMGFVRLSFCQEVDSSSLFLSDAPVLHEKNLNVPNYPTYDEAINKWNNPYDIENWIGAYFEYDLKRAIDLGENSSERASVGILSPDEFYNDPRGVCVDLSRFAVETLNKIDSGSQAKYLMIEFEPIEIEGIVLRKHWVATYQSDKGYYVFGDSKRPGNVVGPFKNVESFIKEYEIFRSRKVTNWKALDSFSKRKKKMRKNG